MCRVFPEPENLHPLRLQLPSEQMRTEPRHFAPSPPFDCWFCMVNPCSWSQTNYGERVGVKGPSSNVACQASPLIRPVGHLLPRTRGRRDNGLMEFFFGDHLHDNFPTRSGVDLGKHFRNWLSVIDKLHRSLQRCHDFLRGVDAERLTKCGMKVGHFDRVVLW